MFRRSVNAGVKTLRLHRRGNVRPPTFARFANADALVLERRTRWAEDNVPVQISKVVLSARGSGPVTLGCLTSLRNLTDLDMRCFPEALPVDVATRLRRLICRPGRYQSFARMLGVVTRSAVPDVTQVNADRTVHKTPDGTVVIPLVTICKSRQLDGAWYGAQHVRQTEDETNDDGICLDGRLQMTSLRSLDLSATFFWLSEDVVPELTGLTGLSLDCRLRQLRSAMSADIYFGELSEDTMRSVARFVSCNSSSLRTLSLTSDLRSEPWWLSDIVECPAVTELSLRPGAAHEGFVVDPRLIAAKTPAVTALTLQFDIGVSCELSRLSGLTCLEVLTLKCGPLVANLEGVADLTRLKSLHLDVWTMTDSVCRGLAGLRSDLVVTCWSASDELTILTSLRELTVRDKMKFAQVMLVAKECRRLEKMDVTVGCAVRTADALESLGITSIVRRVESTVP